MILAATLALTSSFLTTPSVRTESGVRVTLHGTGPPVVFSSGLFGTMPRQLYTELFRHLSSDVTLAVAERVGPVTAATVEEIADALAVERIAFLSHSSIDSVILDSSRVQSAVLCDPVVLPNVDWTRGGLVAPESTPDFPVRVLRAERAYAPETGIPEMISPSIQDGVVSERTFAAMGHADLLDDTWAELGRQALPWMKGATPPLTSFGDWSLDARRKASELRADYRREVADDVVRHLLDRTHLSIQVV